MRTVRGHAPVHMQDASYYRAQAERVRRLLRWIYSPEVEAQLRRIAQDYDEMAEDLEAHAIEIRHPELKPPRRR